MRRAKGIESPIGAPDMKRLDQGEVRRVDLGIADGGSDESQIARLVAALGDTDWRVRKDAATVLAAHDAPGIEEELVAMLSHEDAGMRNAAMKTLIKRGPSSIGALITCMREGDADSRILAAVSLGQIGSPLATAELLNLLAAESDENVRYMVIEALGRIGDLSAVDALMNLMDDDDVCCTAAVVRALGEMRAHEATPRLLTLLDHSVLGGVAAEALGLIRDVRAAVPLYEAALAREDANPAVYLRSLGRILALPSLASSGVAVVLRGMVGEPTQRILDSLLDEMRDPDVEIRTLAIVTSGWIGSPSSATRLVQALDEPATAKEAAVALVGLWKKEPQTLQRSVAEAPPYARAALIGLLAEGGDGDDVELIRPLLEDPNPHVRAEAVSAVGGMGRREHASLIVGHLYDPMLDVRLCAAESIGRLGIDSAAESIVSLAGSHSESDRLVAARAVASACDSDLSPELTEAVDILVRDPATEVRASAVPALAWLESPGTVEYCIAMAMEPNMHTSLAAVAVLGSRTDAAARACVRRLITDERRPVSTAALKAVAAAPDAADRDLLSASAASEDGGRVLLALEGLGRLGTPDAWRIAEEHLDDVRPDVRAAALRLASLAPPAQQVRAVRAACADSSWLVRVAATQMLSDPTIPGVTDLLHALASDADETVRSAALRSLAPVMGGDAVQVIAAHLDDDLDSSAAMEALEHLGDAGVQAAAESLACAPELGGCAMAVFLGRRGTAEAYAALEQMYGSGNPLARFCAAFGLELGHTATASLQRPSGAAVDAVISEVRSVLLGSAETC